MDKRIGGSGPEAQGAHGSPAEGSAAGRRARGGAGDGTGGPPIRLFPPRPNAWIKGFSILFGLASVGIWVMVAGNLGDEGTPLPSELAVSLAFLMALYHAGYFLAPFLVGRGAWLSFLGALTLGPAVHGWLVLYAPALVGPAPTPVKAVGTGCLAALVVLLVIAVRALVAAMRRPGSPAS